ncbi:acyl carrier protein [Paenibacillus lutimineralis]|uniref:Acyl carrier protein n=1 Tax=Paenibacillus lutimineralis TaxID=2707005 RepID=A0A3S9UV17_9BACL|nr:acyl carrier protein [Paenibacillus lutimineralis]AZS14165.1 acyl carrier protein [Paenibacillus lutimineralis]
MNKDQIFEIMREKMLDILPDLDVQRVSREESMKDLGANSIDRFDIISDTMGELNLKIPLVKFGSLKNIGEVVDFLYENL